MYNLRPRKRIVSAFIDDEGSSNGSGSDTEYDPDASEYEEESEDDDFVNWKTLI